MPKCRKKSKESPEEEIPPKPSAGKYSLQVLVYESLVAIWAFTGARGDSTGYLVWADQFLQDGFNIF